MQSIAGYNISKQLMAAGATEEDIKKISQVMALETGIATPEPGPEAHGLPCEVVGSDKEFSNGICKPGFSKEKRRLAKKCKQEGVGL